MPIVIRQRGPSIDVATLRAVENELGCALPEDYARFLIDTNGGVPERNVFLSEELPGMCNAGLFFSVMGEKSAGDLLTEWHQSQRDLPRHMLPIADSACGNLICLSLAPDRFGYIFFWDHEGGFGISTADEYGLVPISTSFSEFWSKLDTYRPPNVKAGVTRVWVHPDLQRILGESSDTP